MIRANPVKFWVKETEHDQNDNPNSRYTLELFELDCSARRIRRAKTLLYADTGSTVGGYVNGAWENIIPESGAEIFLMGFAATDELNKKSFSPR
jgi:hypothetical protein